MQQLGLKSPVRLKKYRSYRGNMGLAAENILQRQFKAEAPCEKWVTDITEFRAGGQKLYLSPILDLFNGEIVAWETACRPTEELVRIPLYSITDWHRSPISDSHPFDQPGT